MVDRLRRRAGDKEEQDISAGATGGYPKNKAPHIPMETEIK